MGRRVRRCAQSLRHDTAGLDWTSDGSSIVFSSSRSGSKNLWRVSVSGGEPELLEVGEQGQTPTLSRVGKRLSYATGNSNVNIWRVGGPSARDEEKMATLLIASRWWDNLPQYSPDGRRVAFGSNRSGFQEVWICDSDGSNPRQLTFFDDPTTGAPSWSPDGRQIAFQSPKAGSIDIYVVSATEGFPRRLTTEPWDEMGPSWSRDGGSVYFASNRTGMYELFKISTEGGDAVQLTTNVGSVAIESPLGRFIYFAKSSPDGGPRGIWRIPADGGEECRSSITENL